MRVLSKLFRRLMLTKLAATHAAGKLQFFGAHTRLARAKAFAAFLASLRKTRWFVYAKRPSAGPKAVLAFLSSYTHRVAISNRRLIALDERSVTFAGSFPGRFRTTPPGAFPRCRNGPRPKPFTKAEVRGFGERHHHAGVLAELSVPRRRCEF